MFAMNQYELHRFSVFWLNPGPEQMDKIDGCIVDAQVASKDFDTWMGKLAMK